MSDTMEKATATVQMDKRGRVVIPEPVRKTLGVNGDAATVEVDVGVIGVLDE